jgi:hypothetical protein
LPCRSITSFMPSLCWKLKRLLSFPAISPRSYLNARTSEGSPALRFHKPETLEKAYVTNQKSRMLWNGDPAWVFRFGVPTGFGNHRHTKNRRILMWSLRDPISNYPSTRQDRPHGQDRTQLPDMWQIRFDRCIIQMHRMWAYLPLWCVCSEGSGSRVSEECLSRLHDLEKLGVHILSRILKIRLCQLLEDDMREASTFIVCVERNQVNCRKILRKVWRSCV